MHLIEDWALLTAAMTVDRKDFLKVAHCYRFGGFLIGLSLEALQTSRAILFVSRTCFEYPYFFVKRSAKAPSPNVSPRL